MIDVVMRIVAAGRMTDPLSAAARMDVRRFRMTRLIAEGPRLLGLLIPRRGLDAILDAWLRAATCRDVSGRRVTGGRGTRRRRTARRNESAADTWLLTSRLRSAVLLAALLREHGN
jgi:hypothetical protein